MARFVLVPGGWHGGWAFDAVSKVLSSEGHEVQALTLSGMADEISTGVNLDRHIDEAVRAIRRSDTRVVLVGHVDGLAARCLRAAMERAETVERITVNIKARYSH